MKIAFKIDRETTREKLIMIVVSLILEIKKENCFLKVALSKTSKRPITRSTLPTEYWNLKIFGNFQCKLKRNIGQIEMRWPIRISLMLNFHQLK